MRLSEAIALGRLLLKPEPYQTILNGKGCALGMAFAALGATNRDEAMKICSTMRAWSWVNKKAILPCNCKSDGMRGDKHGTFHAAIVHLFNEHVCGDEDWTLDQLIDWVRSVEPEETPSLPEAVATQLISTELVEKNLIES